MNMAAEYRERLVRTAESAAGVVFAEKALFALLRLKREAVSLLAGTQNQPPAGTQNQPPLGT